MRTKKVTILLFLTVISLLTMFLVVLLDDKALAAEEPTKQMLPILNLSEKPTEGMLINYLSLGSELKSMEAV